MKKQILIFGGLGNPEHSVIKLYRELMIELYSRYSLIAIDPTPDHESARKELNSQTGIAYHQSYSSFDSYSRSWGVHTLSAVFILTPVIYHLDILKQLKSTVSDSDCLIVIEKPSFSLNEIEQGFNQISKEMKEHGNRFYFIDTAMVTPPLIDFTTNPDIPHNTIPNKIIAVGVDNPINPHPSIKEFGFNNKIAALNERQLLNLATSGGAGFGLDMGIHAIAGFMMLLEKLPISVTKITLDNVILEALHRPDLMRDRNAETYMLCAGNIMSAEAEIAFVIEGGKGTDTWDRRLELYYDNCVVVLGFGTLRHNPYICSFSDAIIHRNEYKVHHSGYVQHFIDIRSLLGLGQTEALVSPELSEKIMRNSMMLIRDIYQFASNSTTQIRNINIVNKHENTLLNTQETHIRAQLNQMLEATL
ncbi:hypothetical protein L3V77_21860 [Vibrio sp. DW001]|uniref:hypothetical protein n=1 Tax=Vibrio sp. DW001 TaxID=2912315 RepID=UPI0023AF1DE2|nr:hypothetical protein [Vibrio sp. DW001]WED28595.1 hypothetical protein L3V77_21860 [Vibrio sp. DW001]